MFNKHTCFLKVTKFTYTLYNQKIIANPLKIKFINDHHSYFNLLFSYRKSYIIKSYIRDWNIYTSQSLLWFISLKNRSTYNKKSKSALIDYLLKGLRDF